MVEWSRSGRSSTRATWRSSSRSDQRVKPGGKATFGEIHYFIHRFHDLKLHQVLQLVAGYQRAFQQNFTQRSVGLLLFLQAHLQFNLGDLVFPTQQLPQPNRQIRLGRRNHKAILEDNGAASFVGIDVKDARLLAASNDLNDIRQ